VLLAWVLLLPMQQTGLLLEVLAVQKSRLQ
jgi:hypothetical protein